MIKAVTRAGGDEAARTWRLLLMRHAKSGYPEGVPDHQRPLAPRGRRQAASSGAWISNSWTPIDVVLCSDACRTRETWQASGIDAAVRYEERLYGASGGQVIEVLADLPNAVRTALVIGHAPGIPQAASVLAGEGSAPEAIHALRAGFPTSAVAVLEFPVPWGELTSGSGRLLAVHSPRA